MNGKIFAIGLFFVIIGVVKVAAALIIRRKGQKAEEA